MSEIEVRLTSVTKALGSLYNRRGPPISHNLLAAAANTFSSHELNEFGWQTNCRTYYRAKRRWEAHGSAFPLNVPIVPYPPSHSSFPFQYCASPLSFPLDVTPPRPFTSPPSPSPSHSPPFPLSRTPPPFMLGSPLSHPSPLAPPFLPFAFPPYPSPYVSSFPPISFPASTFTHLCSSALSPPQATPLNP
jgi:hypothetical protein